MEASQLVESIRGFLNASDQVLTEDVRGWAEVYAKLCREANVRLRECRGLLQKGLRSEAIHIAEMHPALLDLAELLNFPDVKEWKELCVGYSLPEAPGLNLGTVEALSDAYTEEAGLATLMASYRTLNLAQAPVALRLRVARRIAKQDPTTAFWDEDIRALEKLRHEELNESVTDAIAREDLDALRDLDVELSAPGWRIPVAAVHINQIKAVLKKLISTEKLALARELGNKLEQCYSAQELDHCRTLLKDYDRQLHAKLIQEPEELKPLLENVRSWLADETTKAKRLAGYNTACAALVAALDDNAPALQLEALYNAAKGFEYPLDDALEQRYQARCANLAGAQKRKWRLITGGIAAGLIVVLSLIGLFAYWNMREGEIANWIKVAKDSARSLQANDKYEVSQAEKVSATIKQDGVKYLQTPDVVAALGALEAGIATEKQRSGDYALAKRQLDQIYGVIKEDNYLSYAVELQNLTTKAQGLARTNGEKSELGVLLGGLEQKVGQIKTTNDMVVARKYLLLTDDISKIGLAVLTDDPLGGERLYNGFQERFNELKRNNPPMGSASQKQYDRTMELLRQQGEQVAQSKQQANDLAGIFNANNAAARYKDMAAYCTKYPEGKFTAQFTAVLPQQAVETAWEAWLRNAEDYRTQPTALREVKDTVAKLSEFMDANKAVPNAKILRRYVKVLEHVGEVLASDGPYYQLRDVVKNDLYIDTWTVNGPDGTRYFTPSNPEIKFSSLGLGCNVYTDKNLTRKRVVIGDKSVAPTDYPKCQISAHQKLASGILQKINGLTPTNWYQTSAEILELARASDAELPVKGELLLLALKTHQLVVSDYTGTDYGKLIADLETLDLDRYNWIKPGVEKLKKHEQISAVANGLPTSAKAISDIELHLQPVYGFLQMKWLGKGIIKKTSGASVTVVTGGALPVGSEIYALGVSESENSVYKIGTVTDKGYEFDPALIARIQSGAMVYFAAKSK